MALQGTSAPQGLMALFSVQPSTQALNSAPAGALGLSAGSSDEGGAGFSSLLQSLMSRMETATSLLPQAQSLPLSAQDELNSLPPLPPAQLEALAQENTESVLAQLNFGTVQLRPNATKAPSNQPSEPSSDKLEEGSDDSALALLALALPPEAVPLASQAVAANAAPSTENPSTLALSPRTQEGSTLALSVPSEPESEPEPSAQGEAPALDFRAAAAPSKDSSLNASSVLPVSQSPASAGQELTLASSAAPSHVAPALAPSPAAAPATAQVAPSQATFASTQEKMTLGDDSETGVKLGSRILMMVADGVHKARIQLDPPELGSLEIKLHVQQDQASVQVHAATPQVRDALEASAARLRDALASQGVELQHFSVSSGQAGSQGQGGQGQAEDDSTSAEGEWLAEDDRIESPKASSLNLLDTFA